MPGGLDEHRFEALLANMLALWAATDFSDCASWFDRYQQVEAVFGGAEHRIDLVAMNYAVYRAIDPQAGLDVPIGALIDPREVRVTFQANMMRVVMGAAGIWQKANIEIARGYFV